MCGYILTYSRIERENKGTLTSVSAVFHYRDNRQILTHNIRGQKEDFSACLSQQLVSTIQQQLAGHFLEWLWTFVWVCSVTKTLKFNAKQNLFFFLHRKLCKGRHVPLAWHAFSCSMVTYLLLVKHYLSFHNEWRNNIDLSVNVSAIRHTFFS